MTTTRRLLRTHGLLALTTLIVSLAVVRADAASPVRRNVEIEWDGVEGATAYDVRVTRKDGGGAPMTFKLNKSRWSANIKAGLYLMQLRAYDDRGVPGDWSPPSELVVKVPAAIVTAPAPGAIVHARADDEEVVPLAWEPIPGARTYRVVVAGPNFSKSFDTTEAHADAKVPVAAEYTWNVTGVDERGQDGEASSAPYAFKVEGPALNAPGPKRPLSKFADRLSWDNVPHAERYQTELKLYDRTRRAWIAVAGPAEVTTPEYALDPRRAAGRYRLSARAVAANRAASAPGTVDFTAAGGFGDEAAMHDARIAESLRLPGQNVAFAAYRVGPVDYVSRYAETNSLARLSGVSNTVRLGARRGSRRGRWGGAVVADVGTFAIQGAAFVYGSVEARATYRLALGRRDVLTLEGGAFSRQLPVIVGSPTDGFERVTRIGVNGPALGLEYTYAVTERYGLRGDARAYVGLSGGSSREVGAAVIYRAGPNMQWTAGVSSRHDEATFSAKQGGDSFARPGATDQVSMDAVLINVGAAFGF